MCKNGRICVTVTGLSSPSRSINLGGQGKQRRVQSTTRDWNRSADADRTKYIFAWHIASIHLIDDIWYMIYGHLLKTPVLSITSSGEIGFWEHDIEASKMQGRARGRKGERKTHHISHHISQWNLEDIYWMWQKNLRAQERARAKRKGSYPTKK